MEKSHQSKTKGYGNVSEENKHTQENWKLKVKARNEAGKQIIAIREYWKTRAQDLKTSPRDFFKTFRPFLDTRGNAKNGEIKLNVNGTLVRKQKEVRYPAIINGRL